MVIYYPTSLTNLVQVRRAVARKPRDVAAVVFGLKFADDIHYKFKSSQALKLGFRAPNVPAQNRI